LVYAYYVRRIKAKLKLKLTLKKRRAGGGSAYVVRTDVCAYGFGWDLTDLMIQPLRSKALYYVRAIRRSSNQALT
jgi:hypothetical protein